MPGANTEPLRVAIDARLRHGEAGGLESVILGLAFGLSALDGEEEYHFLTIDGEDEWVRTALKGRSTALPMRDPRVPLLFGMRKQLKRLPGASVALRALRTQVYRAPPRSDGTIERHGIHIMHFAHQRGFLTDLPSIYHPHDLQHRHLPEFFTSEELAVRERWYSMLCSQASVIAVASSWTRNDIVEQLGVPESKVHVVPWAPPLDAFEKPTGADLVRVSQSLALPDRYILYPAQTWPHKNHIGLLDALAIIRERHGLQIPVVFTGLRNEFATEIDQFARARHLDPQITWTGFLEPHDLCAVMSLARAVVVPTKFEAASAPVWEALAAGVPTASSNVTSLPAQIGDAGLVFDPESAPAIAEAVLRLWNDTQLRQELIERGRRRIARFTWERSAKHFRALYRTLGSRPLTEEDVQILSETALL